MNYRRYWGALAAVAVFVLLGGTVLFVGVRSQSPSPTVGALITPTPSAVSPTTLATPLTTAAPSPIFAASECTTATATTRQVVERYFALSTSNNVQAVTDCFAKVWRIGSPQPGNSFADGAALWSHAGPATNVVITFVDTVNGCDRFGVSAQLANFGTNNAFSVAPFVTVGPEAGMPRIFETSTAILAPANATTRCG